MKWGNLLFILSVFFVQDLFAQQDATFLNKDFSLLENRMRSSQAFQQQEQDTLDRKEYPSPKSVMFKSMMVPGWGQITNRQIWKVPIIYGLFAGVGYYTYYVHGQYTDYKAAYYNSFPENDDMRFGPTPEHLEGVSPNQLQANRNNLRNQRDFMFVVMGLSYGLNVVDAYVFAHMRSFDVSDDLSARTVVQPALMADGKPGVSLKITFHSR